ncbi:MAG: 30S ribosomal protein S5 [Mycoplasmoidaceae bacterium]
MVEEQPKKEFKAKTIVEEQPKKEFQPINTIEGNNSEKTFVKKDFKKGNFKKNGPKGNSKNVSKQSFTGYHEKVVRIKRISKTTKGGRNMRFSALVIIGDKNGLVGYGTGKSIEVPIAIRKALKDAKNNMVKVKMNKNGSLFHEVIGRKGAGKVLLKPAPEGTGIIAGGPIRVLLEMAGYKDAYSKNLGKNTSLNMVLATLNGLENQKTPREVASLRDKDIKNL